MNNIKITTYAGGFCGQGSPGRSPSCAQLLLMWP